MQRKLLLGFAEWLADNQFINDDDAEQLIENYMRELRETGADF